MEWDFALWPSGVCGLCLVFGLGISTAGPDGLTPIVCVCVLVCVCVCLPWCLGVV